MDTFMPKHGVHSGQSVMNTEVQQQNTTQIQIKGSFNVTVSIEVTQEHEGNLKVDLQS